MSGMTLRSFYDETFKRLFLCGAEPTTFDVYAAMLNHWDKLIGSGLCVDEINTHTLAEFKSRLFDSGLSRATVNKNIRHVNALLAKLGPAGPKNRDALGLVSSIPWVRPMKEFTRRPRTFENEDFKNIYREASRMTLPDVDGINCADWWRALLLTALTTGFRRQALFSLRWSDIDLVNQAIHIEAEEDKANTERHKPLHAITIKHLLRIRTPEGGLVFPWKQTIRNWYRHWHKLQDLADIGRHYKLHDLKRTCGTVFARTTGSAWVVKEMLDHSSINTSRFYVDSCDGLREAVDAFPVGDFLPG